VLLGYDFLSLVPLGVKVRIKLHQTPNWGHFNKSCLYSAFFWKRDFFQNINYLLCFFFRFTAVGRGNNNVS